MVSRTVSNRMRLAVITLALLTAGFSRADLQDKIRDAARRASLDPKLIIRECQGRLESFMVPKIVEIVPELPKTATGKIKKTGLS